MTTTTAAAHGTRVKRPVADRIGYAAALWASSYGVLALVWTLAGSGLPFGVDEPRAQLSALRSLPAGSGAPLFAGVLLSTAVLMAAMAGPHSVNVRGVPRLALLAAGWTSAGALVAVVPAVALLALSWPAPTLVAGAFFGWPRVDYGEIVTWSSVNQAWCLIGGLLVAASTLTWQRRTGSACVSSGQSIVDSASADDPRRLEGGSPC